MSPRFAKLFPAPPVILAPLAGVSDHPFRRICQEKGADMTYVEMISAAALLHENAKTLRMMARHAEEGKLGVQVTGRTALETAAAVEVLDKMNFETIDINMGCPVRKVVKTGCGSAILKDVERVYDTVARCREATEKPLSVKIRIGWDRSSINALEVGFACEKAGCDWLTVHGRTRGDDYSVPVDLMTLAEVKKNLSIPVIGNGNIFTKTDWEEMRLHTALDGVMVSRGALGNPWIFKELKGEEDQVSRQDWLDTLIRHLAYQCDAFGDSAGGALRLRKHLLWYTKGWQGAKKIKSYINEASSLVVAMEYIKQFADDLQQNGLDLRAPLHPPFEAKFFTSQKFKMGSIQSASM